jgi:hypothetical protein
MEVKSILNNVLESVSGLNDYKKVKEIALNRIKSSKVNEKDKNKMLHIISHKRDWKVVKAIYDLILKYEGEGVINKSLSGGRIK